jgi:hypothetical protein
MMGIYAKKFWGQETVVRIILGTCFIAGCSAVTPASDSIKGVVRDQTHGRSAAGVEVILLRLDQASRDQTSVNQSGQEETRTKTDSQGAFKLDVQYPHKLYRVRVVHQGVNYDQPAAAGNFVSINAFDAVSKVQGVTGSIEIIRIQTAGDHLHVSDMIEIKNDSRPPLTQAGERTFEVYLPAHAKIDSALAAGPGRVAALITAAPLTDEPGHYTVNYPLQPGATQFAFNYDLPYEGHATFRPKSIYPLQQLAVMIPPAIRFSSRSSTFQVLRTGNDRYQVEAANAVKAGEGPGFEISGVGEFPAPRAQAPSPPKPPAQRIPAFSSPTSSRAQGTNRLDAGARSRIFAESSRAQWWVFAACAVLALGGCAFVVSRSRHLPDDATNSPDSSNSSLSSLQRNRTTWASKGAP